MTGGEIEETHDLRSQGRTAIHKRGNAGNIHSELRGAAQSRSWVIHSVIPIHSGAAQLGSKMEMEVRR